MHASIFIICISKAAVWTAFCLMSGQNAVANGKPVLSTCPLLSAIENAIVESVSGWWPMKWTSCCLQESCWINLCANCDSLHDRSYSIVIFVTHTAIQVRTGSSCSDASPTGDWRSPGRYWNQIPPRLAGGAGHSFFCCFSTESVKWLTSIVRKRGSTSAW